MGTQITACSFSAVLRCTSIYTFCVSAKVSFSSLLTYIPLHLPPIPQRIAAVTSSLQARLEHSFQVALDKGDRDGLTHCLQAYASISRQEDAESMFQSVVVHPYLEKVCGIVLRVCYMI